MKEKYAIVTGSSSGLGRAIAEILIENDFIVFGGSRSGSDIDHDNFIDINLDVRSEESIEDFFSVIGDTTDKIHLLVNNAGICQMSPVVETSVEDFENHFKTNTLGPFLILKHFHDFIIDGESHVVNILSTAAKVGYPNVSAYSSSKFGFLGLIESVKKEWAGLVKFTNLFPGAIDTPLWDEIGRAFPKNKMLTIEEFIYVFESVIKASPYMQFPDLTFLHKDGFIE
jgi:NAD(P)-dependent dehydrogenase (short-subunit alcohol dehydrogenase family)